MGKQDKDQTCVVAYHASPLPGLTEFRPGTHFGTLVAALERAGARKYEGTAIHVYEVELALQRSLEIYDEGGSHDVAYLVDAARSADRRSLSRFHVSEILRIAETEGQAAGMEALAISLRAQGSYDSMVYRNQTEDEGSLSWIVLSQDQVRVLDCKAADFVWITPSISSALKSRA